jgi:hypothetical protein
MRNRLFIHYLTDWTTKVAEPFTFSLRAPAVDEYGGEARA